MNTPAALAALCAAGSVGAFSYNKINPPRPIARQVSPYIEVARAHLGLDRPVLLHLLDAVPMAQQLEVLPR